MALSNITFKYTTFQNLTYNTSYSYTLPSLSSNQIGVAMGKCKYFYTINFPSGQSYGYALVSVDSFYSGDGTVIKSSNSISGGGTTGQLGYSGADKPQAIIIIYWPSSLDVTSDYWSGYDSYTLASISSKCMGVTVSKQYSKSGGLTATLPSGSSYGYIFWTCNCHMNSQYGTNLDCAEGVAGGRSITIASGSGGTYSNAWFGTIIFYWRNS